MNWSFAADRIVLRDFTVLRDVIVASLDPDGLVLSADRPGGVKVVRWDEVERAQLDDTTKQAEADKLHTQVGEPLFRLRTRLETGDDEGLLAPAEALLPIFRDRRSPTSYVVLQSLVWARLAAGQRERAVEPWLLAFEVLRSRAAKLSDLPGSRRPQLDASSALLGELEPVWFDAKAAAQVLPEAEKALATLADPLPVGARLYVASLALAAKELKEADSFLEGDIDAASVGAGLKQILLCERDQLQGKTTDAVERLQKLLGDLEKATDGKKSPIDLQPLAWFALGRTQLASDSEATRQAGLLSLARIPALFGQQSPELSAAALAEMAEAYAKDTALSARLRSELRRQFYGSWHARRMREAMAAAPR